MESKSIDKEQSIYGRLGNMEAVKDFIEISNLVNPEIQRLIQLNQYPLNEDILNMIKNIAERKKVVETTNLVNSEVQRLSSLFNPFILNKTLNNIIKNTSYIKDLVYPTNFRLPEVYYRFKPIELNKQIYSSLNSLTKLHKIEELKLNIGLSNIFQIHNLFIDMRQKLDTYSKCYFTEEIANNIRNNIDTEEKSVRKGKTNIFTIITICFIINLTIHCGSSLKEGIEDFNCIDVINKALSDTSKETIGSTLWIAEIINEAINRKEERRRREEF